MRSNIMNPAKKCDVDFNIFILLFNKLHITNFQLIGTAIQCWDLFEEKKEVKAIASQNNKEGSFCYATYCLNVKHFP